MMNVKFTVPISADIDINDLVGDTIYHINETISMECGIPEDEVPNEATFAVMKEFEKAFVGEMARLNPNKN